MKKNVAYIFIFLVSTQLFCADRPIDVLPERDIFDISRDSFEGRDVDSDPKEALEDIDGAEGEFLKDLKEAQEQAERANLFDLETKDNKKDTRDREVVDTHERDAATDLPRDEERGSSHRESDDRSLDVVPDREQEDTPERDLFVRNTTISLLEPYQEAINRKVQQAPLQGTSVLTRKFGPENVKATREIFDLDLPRQYLQFRNNFAEYPTQQLVGIFDLMVLKGVDIDATKYLAYIQDGLEIARGMAFREGAAEAEAFEFLDLPEQFKSLYQETVQQVDQLLEVIDSLHKKYRQYVEKKEIGGWKKQVVKEGVELTPDQLQQLKSDIDTVVQQTDALYTSRKKLLTTIEDMSESYPKEWQEACYHSTGALRLWRRHTIYNGNRLMKVSKVLPNYKTMFDQAGGKNAVALRSFIKRFVGQGHQFETAQDFMNVLDKVVNILQVKIEKQSFLSRPFSNHDYRLEQAQRMQAALENAYHGLIVPSRLASLEHGALKTPQEIDAALFADVQLVLKNKLSIPDFLLKQGVDPQMDSTLQEGFIISVKDTLEKMHYVVLQSNPNTKEQIVLDQILHYVRSEYPQFLSTREQLIVQHAKLPLKMLFSSQSGTGLILEKLQRELVDVRSSQPESSVDFESRRESILSDASLPEDFKEEFLAASDLENADLPQNDAGIDLEEDSVKTEEELLRDARSRYSQLVADEVASIIKQQQELWNIMVKHSHHKEILPDALIDWQNEVIRILHDGESQEIVVGLLRSLENSINSAQEALLYADSVDATEQVLSDKLLNTLEEQFSIKVKTIGMQVNELLEALPDDFDSNYVRLFVKKQIGQLIGNAEVSAGQAKEFMDELRMYVETIKIQEVANLYAVRLSAMDVTVRMNYIKITHELEHYAHRNSFTREQKAYIEDLKEAILASNTVKVQEGIDALHKTMESTIILGTESQQEALKNQLQVIQDVLAGSEDMQKQATLLIHALYEKLISFGAAGDPVLTALLKTPEGFGKTLAQRALDKLLLIENYYKYEVAIEKVSEKELQPVFRLLDNIKELFAPEVIMIERGQITGGTDASASVVTSANRQVLTTPELERLAAESYTLQKRIQGYVDRQSEFSQSIISLRLKSIELLRKHVLSDSEVASFVDELALLKETVTHLVKSASSIQSDITRLKSFNNQMIEKLSHELLRLAREGSSQEQIEAIQQELGNKRRENDLLNDYSQVISQLPVKDDLVIEFYEQILQVMKGEPFNLLHSNVRPEKQVEDFEPFLDDLSGIQAAAAIAQADDTDAHSLLECLEKLKETIRLTPQVDALEPRLKALKNSFAELTEHMQSDEKNNRDITVGREPDTHEAPENTTKNFIEDIQELADQLHSSEQSAASLQGAIDGLEKGKLGKLPVCISVKHMIENLEEEIKKDEALIKEVDNALQEAKQVYKDQKENTVEGNTDSDTSRQ